MIDFTHGKIEVSGIAVLHCQMVQYCFRQIGSLQFADVYKRQGAEKVTVTVIQESAEDLDINTPEGYRLVWHDEFNEGTSLGNDWTRCV